MRAGLQHSTLLDASAGDCLEASGVNLGFRARHIQLRTLKRKLATLEPKTSVGSPEVVTVARQLRVRACSGPLSAHEPAGVASRKCSESGSRH